MPEGTTDNGSSTPSSPSSAASAMESAASSAATAAGAPAASSTPSAPAGSQPASSAPATAGAAAGGQPPAQPAAGTQRGPIPFDRHQAALANLRRQYAWAEGMDANQVRADLALVQRMRSNPRDFWQQLGREIGGDQPEPELPRPDLRSEDGRLAYSAETMAKYMDIREQALMRKLMGELQPFVEGYQQDRDQRAQEAQSAQQRSVIAHALAQLRAQPSFKDNEKLIAEKLEAMDESYVESVGLVTALHVAYNQVLSEVVFPGYEDRAAARVREENQRKAGTAGSAPPTSGTPSSSGKLPSNQRELASHLERLSREGIPAGRF